MAESIAENVVVVADLDPNFSDEVASLPGGTNIKRCFACGTCAAGCPVTTVDQEYNCRTIIRKVLLGMREEVLKSPVIWFCVMCYRCYARCPQQVNFTDIMKVLRYLAIKEGYVSSDMLTNSSEVDRLAHMIRRDMIKSSVEGRKQVIEEIKTKIAETSA